MARIRQPDGTEIEVTDVDAVNLAASDPSLKIIGDVRVAPDQAGQATVTESADVATGPGHRAATAGEQAAFAHHEHLEGQTSLPGAIIRRGLAGATFGASDLIFGDEQREADETIHPYASTAAEIGGAFLPGVVGEGLGAAKLFGGAADAEHAAGALSSKLLYSGEVGAEAGSEAKAVEKGLARAKGAIDESAAARATAPELAGLDIKGLNQAERDEVAGIKAGRGGDAQALADDLGSYRTDQINQKIWLATKDAEEREIRSIGRVSMKADKALDNMLDNPKKLVRTLGERPSAALDVLESQEAALTKLQAQEPRLRVKFAADTSGERAAALDAVPDALERNRALQERLKGLMAEPVSERLTAIRDAKAALGVASAPAEKSLVEQMLGGTIFGHVAHAVGSSVPILGPMLGAKAAKLATDVVFGRMGKATAAAALRTKQAVNAFMGAAKLAAVPEAVVATKVLSRVRYAPQAQSRELAPIASSGAVPAPKAEQLASLYKQRSAEIRSQMQLGPDGVATMRPDARATMAEMLRPVRAVDPVLADRMETIGARRLEFLASKLPKRPDLGMPLGPDHWQPSDLAMRAFARYAAAVEDPGGVEERVAHGTVTPEDAEAYHAVYPERAAEFTRQVQANLPKLQKSLPYARKISLSIFTGVAVDPAMRPEVLRVLQGQFEEEPGTSGGTQLPTPSPQFGSVKKSVSAPTPGQQRSG